MDEEQRSVDAEPVPRDPDERGEVFEGEDTSDTAVRTAVGAALPGAFGGLVGGGAVGASVDNREADAGTPPAEEPIGDEG